MSRYFIGIDAEEVISSLFHGGNGFATAEEATAHLETYGDQAGHFRVYRASIEPVIPGKEDEQVLLRSLFDNVALDEHFDFDLTNMVNSLDDAHRIFESLLQRLRNHDRVLRKRASEEAQP